MSQEIIFHTNEKLKSWESKVMGEPHHFSPTVFITSFDIVESREKSEFIFGKETNPVMVGIALLPLYYELGKYAIFHNIWCEGRQLLINISGETYDDPREAFDYIKTKIFIHSKHNWTHKQEVDIEDKLRRVKYFVGAVSPSDATQALIENHNTINYTHWMGLNIQYVKGNLGVINSILI